MATRFTERRNARRLGPLCRLESVTVKVTYLSIDARELAVVMLSRGMRVFRRLHPIGMNVVVPRALHRLAVQGGRRNGAMAFSVESTSAHCLPSGPERGGKERAKSSSTTMSGVRSPSVSCENGKFVKQTLKICPRELA